MSVYMCHAVTGRKQTSLIQLALLVLCFERPRVGVLATHIGDTEANFEHSGRGMFYDIVTNKRTRKEWSKSDRNNV